MAEEQAIPLQESRKDQFYRSIFEKYDVDQNGFLNVGELNSMIESTNYEHDIPPHVVQKIHKMADKNSDNRIDFREFMEMVHHPGLQHIFGRYVRTYVELVVPSRNEGRPVNQNETCSCYFLLFSGMIIISVIEIIFYCVSEAFKVNSENFTTGPVGDALIYDPQRRREVWRFITYMFVHTEPVHITMNVVVQLCLGVTLEIVHTWWRVLIIYFLGVLAGSLATSIVDPMVRLAGASGGVYSLVTAHIGNVILNWSRMTHPAVQLLFFLVVAATDIGMAVHERVTMNSNEGIGHIAHLGGAIAGLLVGLNVLRNFEVTKVEKVVWWVSMILFVSLIGLAIILNFTLKDYFPREV